jgi:WD40 repeat protein
MQYTGHTGTVFTIVWSPDEDLIFTFGADGTARVFEVATGAELLVYQIGAYTDGALSPDGTQVLIASGDGNTYIFPTWLTSEDLIAYAKENCLIGELTSDERDLFGSCLF